MHNIHCGREKAEGFTYKVIQRRALEIKKTLIYRYANELNSMNPLPFQLLFLDEVSLDNRGMLETRGYFKRGTDPVYRGVFTRSERISLLAFCNEEGLTASYRTEGTFTRQRFFDKYVD